MVCGKPARFLFTFLLPLVIATRLGTGHAKFDKETCEDNIDVVSISRVENGLLAVNIHKMTACYTVDPLAASVPAVPAR